MSDPGFDPYHIQNISQLLQSLWNGQELYHDDPQAAAKAQAQYLFRPIYLDNANPRYMQFLAAHARNIGQQPGREPGAGQ